MRNCVSYSNLSFREKGKHDVRAINKIRGNAYVHAAITKRTVTNCVPTSNRVIRLPIGYFQQGRRYRETYRFWNIWRPQKSQFLCNYTRELTSMAFYGQNGSVNKLSNRLFLNINLFPVLKKLFFLKSKGWIASCPYFQWDKINKLFKNENFNLVRPTPVLQLVPLENTQWNPRNESIHEFLIITNKVNHKPDRVFQSRLRFI
jgi:hypothetical protein